MHEVVSKCGARGWRVGVRGLRETGQARSGPLSGRCHHPRKPALELADSSFAAVPRPNARLRTVARVRCGWPGWSTALVGAELPFASPSLSRMSSFSSFKGKKSSRYLRMPKPSATMPKPLLVVLSLCAHTAESHGRLLVPAPRPPLWRDPENMKGDTHELADYRENEPAFQLGGPMTHGMHTYTGTAYRCHDFAASQPEVTLTAGSEVDLEWQLDANHPGDCALYVSCALAEEETRALLSDRAIVSALLHAPSHVHRR